MRRKRAKSLYLKFLLCAVLLVIGGTIVVFTSIEERRTRINFVSLPLPQMTEIMRQRFDGLKIAVAADFHSGEAGLEELSGLIDRIKLREPDLVLLLGDYITSPRSVSNLSKLRADISKRLARFAETPHVAVLGNYETLSNADRWLTVLRHYGIRAIENDVAEVSLPRGLVCVRGLGDRYSERFRYIDFSDKCADALKITVTHDPAGIFDDRVRGLAFAAHTHCGQISLPLIGPLWVPSDAPRAAYCGHYTDNQRTLFVTSGVGTSILPIRFGAPSQWDLVTLKAVTPGSLGGKRQP